MNERRFALAAGPAAALILVLATAPAWAVIERLTPLEEVINKQASFIFTAKVDKLDPDKPSAVLEVGEALKGKAPFTRLPINLTGDGDAKKKKETPQLLKRLAPKLPLVVFVIKQDKQYIGFAYTNGTWFQMTAQEGAENPVWSFTHCEPYLRRTFKGTTAEMQQTVADSLSGKKAAPAPDPKEKPGLGPEVEEKPKEGKDEKPAPSPPAAMAGAAGGPLFAVIPSVAIGGVLSLLAMLFPAVFGGLTGQLKRWMAVISVASLNTTLLWLHDWLAPRLQGSWWGTQTALWVTMIVITALGVLWAWRRQLRDLSSGREAPAGADTPPGVARPRDALPSRYEQVLLLILSGIGVALFAVCLLLKYPILALPWSFVLALWVGIWVGTLYVLAVRLRAARPRTRPALSSEGMVLWAMLPACLALGCSSGAPVVVTGSAGGGAVQRAGAGHGAEFVEAAFAFAPQGGIGYIASRPLIDGDRVYTAAAHGSSLTPFGKVYCIERDRATDKFHEVWSFNDDGKMKQVFSSPCLADGKLYIGEGFHSDSSCKLYCLDAATGKKVWEYATESHTESSPCVADGKVYCGAGGDGLLCLNAATGEKVWQYAVGHIDCPPVVVGKRLYCGSGVDRDIEGAQETAIFCLDAETGQEIWKVKTDLPAWGRPFVTEEQAFFSLGNGDALNPVEAPGKPGGAVVCVSPKDGKKQLWRFDVSDGVIEGPAVDRRQVYFGGRDGYCYCVGRDDGKLRWKHDLGAPVIVSPALAACSYCGVTTSVYAVAAGNPEKRVPARVCCLDPAGGSPLWEYDQFPGGFLISPPVVTVEHTDQGDRRFVYFGAGLNNYQNAVLYCLKDQWKKE